MREHPVGDEEAADDVDHAERDRHDEEDRVDDRRVLQVARARSGRRAARCRGSRWCPTSAACAACWAPSRSPRSRRTRPAPGSRGRRAVRSYAITAGIVRPSRVTQDPRAPRRRPVGRAHPRRRASAPAGPRRCARTARDACSGIVAGRFSGEAIVTSCLTTTSPGLGELAVAAALPREVDDHAARAHPLHGLRRSPASAPAARHVRGGDHDVEAGDRLLEALLLLAPARPRSARGRSRPRRRPRSRGRATARRASAPGRPPPAGRRSRWCGRRAAWPWPAPAGRRRPTPSTSTVAGFTVPAAVVSIGKKRVTVLRREQHGPVAGDVGLRRQRVHDLRARDPRDRLHRERRARRPSRSAATVSGAVSGARKPMSTVPRPQPADLLGGRRGDLDHDVGRPRITDRGARVA